MKLINEQIQYIEFLSNDLSKIKEFYQNTFSWKFTDYGEEYTAFEGKHIDGGFTKGTPVKGSILVVMYADNLEKTKEKVEKNNGSIIKDIFSFPGGRRFHFEDPDQNEIAVWSNK